jgi:hypothetical protein
VKSKRSLGFANQDDDQIICRRILLNTLKRGPVMVERIVASAARDFGFTRAEVVAAARWWNVIEETRDGQTWWRKPDVLTLLPKWTYRPRERRLELVVA